MPKKVENKASEAFAVIATGGKQYPVSIGDTLRIEKLDGEFEIGAKVVFDKVLMTGNGDDIKIGTPLLPSKVTAEFLGNDKAAKIRVTRFKSKSNRHRTIGHRQPYTKVKITAIA